MACSAGPSASRTAPRPASPPRSSTAWSPTIAAKTPPPSKRGRRLRLYYAAQVGDRPPRIAIQVNDRRLISRDWAYHLENRLRDAGSLRGVPLVIDFVPHSGRNRPRHRSR